MKKLLVSLSLALISSQAKADNIQAMSGCLDCFNFAAPSLSYAENINSTAQTGLIVFDTYSASFGFRGYIGGNAWSKLSNELIYRPFTSSSGTPSYSAAVQDDVIGVNASSYAATVVLPSPAALTGKVLTIKKTDSTFNQVTVSAGSQYIDGNGSSRKLSTNGEIIKLVSDGSNWQIVDRRIPNEWASFPSGAGGSWTGGGITYTAKYRRIGDTMEISYRVDMTGGPTGSQLTLNLPTGVSIDTSKLSSGGSGNYYIGFGNAHDNGVGQSVCAAVYYNTTSVALNYLKANAANNNDTFSGLTTTSPQSFGANDSIDITFKVPISGWEG